MIRQAIAAAGATLALLAPAVALSLDVPAASVAAAQAAAAARPAAQAASIAVDLQLGSGSRWLVEAGQAVLRERIRAPGASAIGFYAPQLAVPAGTLLSVRAGSAELRYSGAELAGPLWVPLLAGEVLDLELRVPASQTGAVALRIAKLDVALPRRISAKAAPGGCSDLVNYECRREPANTLAARASVQLNFRLSSSVDVCSGTLVNPIGAATNYVLTAAHCRDGQTPESISLAWAASVPCDTGAFSTLSASDYSKANSTGAELVAEYNDVALYRIGRVPISADGWRAGFDAGSTAGAAPYFGIHYASGRPQQWLRDHDGALSALANGWMLVARFADGEGTAGLGASGSGLFNAGQRVTGVLSAIELEGCANYVNGEQEVIYDSLAAAWIGGGTAASSLRPWLDPNGSGQRSNAGAAAAGASSPVEGACGYANGGSYTTFPSTANACDSGTLVTSDATGSDGQFNWQCQGSGGGNTAACAATRLSVINGSCGTAANTGTLAYPTTSLCAAGSAQSGDTVASDGSYNWTCKGANGGSDSSCAAPRRLDGVCGSAAGVGATTYPGGANRCAVGTVQTVDSEASDGSYNWNCAGSNGGTVAACSAPLTVNGQCGSAQGPATASYPVSGLCSAGAVIASDSTGGDGSYNWNCSGAGGGTTAACATPRLQAGVCGPVAGTTSQAFPSAGLCAVGAATPLDASGSDGSFDWSCAGSNGGAAQNCSATRGVATDGACGSAAGLATAALPSGAQCAAGLYAVIDGSGSDGQFDWRCSGSNGGASASCSAPRQVPVAGSCGSAQGQATVGFPAAGLCGNGAAVAGDTNGSDGSFDWSCSGTDGGAVASCSAPRQSDAAPVPPVTTPPVTTPEPAPEPTPATEDGAGGGGALDPLSGLILLLFALGRRRRAP